eukprot:921416-Pleurochrysis_carterae.AAC.1
MPCRLHLNAPSPSHRRGRAHKYAFPSFFFVNCVLWHEESGCDLLYLQQAYMRCVITCRVACKLQLQTLSFEAATMAASEVLSPFCRWSSCCYILPAKAARRLPARDDAVLLQEVEPAMMFRIGWCERRAILSGAKWQERQSTAAGGGGRLKTRWGSTSKARGRQRTATARWRDSQSKAPGGESWRPRGAGWCEGWTKQGARLREMARGAGW